MAVLEWDKTGERYYETGVDRGVLFPMNDDGTYAAGVAWNGLTAVNESPSGAEPNNKWADNMKYATLRSAEQYEATIEAMTYPDEFGECDGTAELATGVRIGGQARKAFGFSFRTKVGNDAAGMDKGYKIHLVYGATAKPSEKNYETVNEDPDAMTFSWEVTTTPVSLTGHEPVSHIVIDSTKFTGDNVSKLTNIENTLYGTANSDSELPLPSNILTIMNGS